MCRGRARGARCGSAAQRTVRGGAWLTPGAMPSAHLAKVAFPCEASLCRRTVACVVLCAQAGVRGHQPDGGQRVEAMVVGSR